MISPARVAAFEMLQAISSGRLDLPAAVASVREAIADERDRALAAEIATGVQRWRAAIDHLIAHFAKRPVGRLDLEIVDILRLGAYQLLYLTRVPAAAVVDDAVQLTRRAAKTSASGFVNAVLRAISRSRAALPLPRAPANPDNRQASLDYLATTLSHPRWLVARLYDRLGFHAAEAWVQFNNRRAPLTLRANRLRCSRDELARRLADEGVAGCPTRFAPDGFIVTTGHPLRGRGLHDGWFVVQDEASQLVALVAQAVAGRRTLDACAAPGGKTTAMAATVKDEGLIVACDIRHRRMELLRRTIAATGASNVRLVQADLLRALPFSARFDCVVVDAPCSGLGTLRRDPDIKWRRSERDLEPLAAAQRLMLHHAADVVVRGGRLVYSTCSSEPEENDGVIDELLAGGSEFRLAHAAGAVPDLPRELVDDRGFLRTEPHAHGLEAFFAAVLVRT
jgi:16S rRNA (cytosine967-C5)-methyltransferase